MPDDDAPEATEEEIKYIQQVVGTILYYAQAVDLTLLMALSTLVQPGLLVRIYLFHG